MKNKLYEDLIILIAFPAFIIYAFVKATCSFIKKFFEELKNWSDNFD